MNILVLCVFNGLTPICGGIAMLVDAEHFPLVWLNSTPFSSFTVPALFLSLLVGGFHFYLYWPG
jgi:hypothetical protein